MYPASYGWYVFLSAMDLMLTWLVLHSGGHELNVLADWVINRWDLPGVVAFKFALVVSVIFICEVVGRRNVRLGGCLAAGAAIVTAVPVGLTLVQLASEFSLLVKP